MRKGFTLLELLIVIVVIGILAAVSVPRLVSFIDEGKSGGTQAEMSAIKSAARLFVMHTKRYPEDVAELVVNKKGGTGNAIPGWKGPYVEDEVSEVAYDQWGNKYLIYSKELSADGTLQDGKSFTIDGKTKCGILLVSPGKNGVDDGGGQSYGDGSDDLYEWLKFDGEPTATATP